MLSVMFFTAKVKKGSAPEGSLSFYCSVLQQSLFCYVLAEAHDDGSHLGPGSVALGCQSAAAYAVTDGAAYSVILNVDIGHRAAAGHVAGQSADVTAGTVGAGAADGNIFDDRITFVTEQAPRYSEVTRT